MPCSLMLFHTVKFESVYGLNDADLFKKSLQDVGNNTNTENIPTGMRRTIREELIA